MQNSTQQVRITAKCPYFELVEFVPERRAEKRLKQIRELFLWSQRHAASTAEPGHNRREFSTLFVHVIKL